MADNPDFLEGIDLSVNRPDASFPASSRFSETEEITAGLVIMNVAARQDQFFALQNELSVLNNHLLHSGATTGQKYEIYPEDVSGLKTWYLYIADMGYTPVLESVITNFDRTRVVTKVNYCFDAVDFGYVAGKLLVAWVETIDYTSAPVEPSYRVLDRSRHRQVKKVLKHATPRLVTN